MKTFFADLIGQDDVKKKLGFYIEAHSRSSKFPFLLLTGARGQGKTEFAKETARNLKAKDGAPKAFVEINCGTIKNAQTFFEQVFAPVIQGNEVTVLLDECHALPKDLMTVMLTAFNTEKADTKQVSWREGLYEFNFKLQSYILATTEPDKLFNPFKDRLTPVDFQTYSNCDIVKIIKKMLPDVDFKGEALERIATTVRGNARSAVHRAKQIELYCDTKANKNFGCKEWDDLCNKIGIHAAGLSNTEIQVLRALKTRGDLSLNMLSAITGMSRTSLQRDVEMFLLQKGFMTIEGQRKITAAGTKILEEVEHKK